MTTILGQYLDIDSGMHRLHPITKLVGLFILMTITLLLQSTTAYFIQLGLLLLVLVLTKLPLSIMAKSLWSVRFIFIFIFIFNVLFMRSGDPIWQFGFIAIYPETLTFTLNLVLRLVILTSYATILTLTTKPLDLTYAVEQMLKPFGNIGHVVGMILAIALRFIPTLQEEASKIMKAQQSRGANFSSGSIFKRANHFVSLLIPLFIISFNRAETLAIAMELRGYDPDGVRTRFHVLHWHWFDTVVLIGLIGIMCGIILLKFISGGLV